MYSFIQDSGIFIFNMSRQINGLNREWNTGYDIQLKHF
jgi:hypothetical protein